MPAGADAYFLFGTIFSTLTNGVIVLGLHGMAFIGGWLEQIGTVTQSVRLINLGILSSVLMPSEAIWRRASYVMQSSMARTLDFSPFTTRSAPSTTMVLYAICTCSLHLRWRSIAFSSATCSAGRICEPCGFPRTQPRLRCRGAPV